MEANSSCLPSFTPQQTHHILLTYGSIGALTVTFCLIGIILVFFLKLHKMFVYRLAMYQVMAALFFGLTRTLQLISLRDQNEAGNEESCDAVAYLVVCSSWIKLLLTLWVTVHLFVYTVFLKNMTKLEPFYVVSAVAIGPLIASIPFFTQSYGHAGPWCWIKGHKTQCNIKDKFETGEIQQIALWYGPAFLVLLINSILVIITVAVFMFRIHFRVWSHSARNSEHQSLMEFNSNRHRQALHLLLPLLAYPVIFCILITIPLSNRIYGIVSARPNYALFMASAVSIPAMGLAAGAALIIHILFMKRQVLVKFSTDHFAPSVQTERNDGGGGYCSGKQTRLPTSSATQFVMVNESEVYVE